MRYRNASCKIGFVGKSAYLINRAVMQSLEKSGQFQLIQSTRKGSQRDLVQAVPQTDSGGLVENTKASERKRLKELGKQTGRNLGRCPPRTNLTENITDSNLSLCYR